MKVQMIYLIVMLSFIVACSKNNVESQTEQDLVIKGGYFFGECSGICQASIEFAGNKVKYTAKDSGKNNAEKKCSSNVSAKLIEDLKTSFDFEEFKKLPTVIGCPDCGDAGAQWIEISKAGESHRVVFDYARPPTVIKELGNFFSSQFASFRNCR